MTPQGTSLIGQQAVTGGQAVIRAIDPSTSETLAPDYPTADDQILTSYRERLTE